MSATTPSVGFVGLDANCLPTFGNIRWEGAIGSGVPNPIDLPIGVPLEVVVSVLGGYIYGGETGDFVAGSTTITSIPSTAPFTVDQMVQDLAPGEEAFSFLPTGPNFIASLTSTSLVFVNYPEPPGTPALGALQSGTAVAFMVTDPFPLGHLVFTISPSSGWTMVDVNADGSGNTSNVGNGSFVANLTTEAEGSVGITFSVAGTYTVSAAYSPADANYLAATVPAPLTIVVA